jgi:hypothetical protein
MGYFNKRGIGVGWVVMAIVAIVGGMIAIFMFSGIADVIKENADFNCLVGIRLASISGAQTSPCKTSLTVITPMEFKKDREGNLNFDFKNCPQVKAQAEYFSPKELSRACETVKLADKGLTCWTNYMSGKGNLPTWTCFSVCLKPSYGSILLDESKQTIKLPNKFFDFENPELDNFYIFPGKKFKSDKIQDLSKLEPYIGNSFGVELEKTDDDSIIKLKEGSRYNDVSLVIKLPFESVTPTGLKEVFMNGKTTRRFSQGETYESRISTERIRINTAALFPLSFDTNIIGDIQTLDDIPVGLAVDKLIDGRERFYFTENSDWTVQYIDSDDWSEIPFTDIGFADINRNLDWDINKDSINYGYNGVC